MVHVLAMRPQDGKLISYQDIKKVIGMGFSLLMLYQRYTCMSN